MPLGVPLVVNANGTFTTLPPSVGALGQLKRGLEIVVHVLVSRPVRPYEAAIGFALLKALEKSFGFHIGF